MRIILVGYMASGKTSIGKKLSKKMNVPFIDLDSEIESIEGMPISKIFKTKGEVYFRKMETYYLKTILESQDNFILAVGGGTPCYGTNMELMNSYGDTFYLKSSLKNSYAKLAKLKNKQKRPLISDIPEDRLEEFIAKHLFERVPFYEKAKHCITIDNKKKKEIVDEISLSMQ